MSDQTEAQDEELLGRGFTDTTFSAAKANSVLLLLSGWPFDRIVGNPPTEDRWTGYLSIAAPFFTKAMHRLPLCSK